MSAGFESHTKHAHRHSYCNRKRVIDFFKINIFLFAVLVCLYDFNILPACEPSGKLLWQLYRGFPEPALATAPALPGTFQNFPCQGEFAPCY